jgi:hypothetical protein
VGEAPVTPVYPLDSSYLTFPTNRAITGGGGTVNVLCPHDYHQGKPYIGSYTRVRRQLCGTMETDDNKGSLGINVFPNISKEQRQIYIKIEEAAQRKHGKKQKLQSDDVSSRFGGTSPSPRRSTTSTSRRTIGDFFDIGGRDEVDAKVACFLYACGVPLNVLRSPYWHDMVRAINEKYPQGYKSPNYEKARIVFSQVRYVLQFTKPIYNMIKFSDSDRPIIGEVYEQMDSMLGLIKDIVEPKDVNMYNLIRVEVEKRWEMLNIPLHALAYVLTPKYYHVSWLSTPAPGGGTKKKPHQDPEVQAGRNFFKQFLYNNFYLWFMFISIFYLWFIFIIHFYL